MFEAKEEQLKNLTAAYRSFMSTLKDLPSENFLASLGDWTPRDIAAHFIGWNRITLAGCSALREGAEPFYFYDGTNDYRKINGKFLTQFPSTDRAELSKEIAFTYEVLQTYLQSIPEAEWESDTGITHYRGNPATVARCVDSLIRDYGKHRQEILDAFGQ